MNNLYEKIEKYLQSHGMVNIVISGTTCSGKTTLANAIRGYFSDKYAVAIVHQDDYFKDLLDIPRGRWGYLADSIDAFWTEEFKHDVNLLLQNGVAIVPKYDIATNTRIAKSKIVRGGKINIFEGLHTIHILKGLDDCVTIYLDTGIETCLERRIERDTLKYGIPEERIREYWDDCIIPMCERFVFPQKAYADIIISSK